MFDLCRHLLRIEEFDGQTDLFYSDLIREYCKIPYKCFESWFRIHNRE